MLDSAGSRFTIGDGSSASAGPPSDGCASGSLRATLALQPEEALVHGAFVAPDMRRQDVSSQGGIYRLRWLRDAGYRRVMAAILPENTAGFGPPGEAWLPPHRHRHRHRPRSGSCRAARPSRSGSARSATLPERLVHSETVITRSESLMRRLRSLLELVVTVAVAVGLALLIQAFVVKPYRVPSGSMLPTLALGQRILVNRMDTHPGIGDVVVFHPPTVETSGRASVPTPSRGSAPMGLRWLNRVTGRWPASQNRPLSSASSACPVTCCGSWAGT